MDGDKHVEFRARVNQGEKGQWRFLIDRLAWDVDDDYRPVGEPTRTFHAVSKPRGYATRQEASDAAAELLNGEWYWDD